MKCFHCDKEVPEYGGIVLNLDGDFVCSKTCEQNYQLEKDRFFNEVVRSESKTTAWLLGDIQ